MNKNTALILLPLFWPKSPPLSLATLKGYLNKHKKQADIIDYNNYFFNKVSPDLKKQWNKSCNKELEDNILNILQKEYIYEFNKMLNRLSGYNTIGFSCYKSNFKLTLEISKLIKQKNPELKIIYGGPEITRQYFKKNGNLIKRFNNLADFIVVGEGERSLLNYLNRNINGKTSRFIEIEDKEDIPIPDYSNFDFSDYPRAKSISLMYSRGCIRKCNFCSEKLLYKKFKTSPIENIIKQITDYRDKGINNFIFHDSLINGDLKALELLCDEIVEKFGSINWEAQITVRNDMPDKLFKKIKNSGCYHLFIGLESGSDKILKSMNKGFNTIDAVDFFKKLDSFGLSFGVSIITGYPGEVYSDHSDSLNFVIKNKNIISKIEQINPYTYYEGTNLPEESGYKNNKESLKRADEFINRIKEAGFKYTNAFMLNLVEN